jgi:hypothetical protein
MNYSVDKYIVSGFDSSTFIAEIIDDGVKRFTVNKKPNEFDMAHLIKGFDGIEACFISKTHIAILISPN